jgi:AAA+ ATPase superfamily predicted ATPase
MKFYDRQAELAILAQNREASEKSACFTAICGRRRVGKTALILKSPEGARGLYRFVSGKSESLICGEFQAEAEAALGLRVYGAVTRFRDLFEQLLRYSEQTPFILVPDEFQEFERVNPYEQFSGLTPEQYFREKLEEESRMTRIGGYVISEMYEQAPMRDHSARVRSLPAIPFRRSPKGVTESVAK